MPKTEHPLYALAAYLPHGCFDDVAHYLVRHKVHLTISRARRSVLGNYRSAYRSANHRISVNGNLNPYAFLITLLHELAHLLTYEAYGAKVLSHGKEWKNFYSVLLNDFLSKNVFPADIVAAIQNSIKNPAASACAEEGLMRVLKQYDTDVAGKLLLENIPDGHTFKYSSRVYKKGKKRTKRFECVDVNSGRLYLFSPICEVDKV